MFVQDWQVVTGAIIFVIAVVGAAVAITRYTTELEDRINLLEEGLNTHRESLDIQRGLSGKKIL